MSYHVSLPKQSSVIVVIVRETLQRQIDQCLGLLNLQTAVSNQVHIISFKPQKISNITNQIKRGEKLHSSTQRAKGRGI